MQVNLPSVQLALTPVLLTGCLPHTTRRLHVNMAALGNNCFGNTMFLARTPLSCFQVVQGTDQGHATRFLPFQHAGAFNADKELW